MKPYLSIPQIALLPLTALFFTFICFLFQKSYLYPQFKNILKNRHIYIE